MKVLVFIASAFLASILVYLAIRTTGPAPFPATQIERSFVDIPNFRMAYNQKGRGQDVLLLHGAPGSIEDWQILYETIDLTKYRVTSYDRPGYGASSHSASSKGAEGHIEDNVDAALHIINALDLNHVVVVGHSYGGSTAIALAQRNDPRVAGAVALGPPILAWNKISSLYYLLTAPLLGGLFAETLTPLFAESMITEGLQSSFHNNTAAIPSGFVDFRTKLWSQPLMAISKAQEMVHLDADLKSLSPRLSQTRQPITVVLGALDQPHIVATNRQLAREHPNVKLVELAGIGHYPQVENPETVIKAIGDLLSTP